MSNWNLKDVEVLSETGTKVIAVTGRYEGDDDDTLKVYQCNNLGDAQEAFAAAVKGQQTMGEVYIIDTQTVAESSPELTVPYPMAAEMITLCGEVHMLMENDETFTMVYEEIEIGMDSMRFGMYQILVEVVNMIHEGMKWEDYDAGVFCYDHCEKQLPELIMHSMQSEHWRQVCFNSEVPTAPLDAVDAYLADNVNCYTPQRAP